jgi:hypothetical protein
MTPDVNPDTRRRYWARVAEAAAMHQRCMAGEDVSYGDSDLRRTGKSVARTSLLRTVEQALAAGVESEEIVDAICSGDRTFEVGEARQYVQAVPQLGARIEELNARLLRGFLEGRD